MIVAEYDQYSLYDFLQVRGLSTGAIEMYAVMNFLESDLHMSCIEVLREDLGGYYSDMVEIVGGMDRLPQAFFHDLQDEVRLGAEVPPSSRTTTAVTVHYTDRGRPVRGQRRLRGVHVAVLGVARRWRPSPAGRRGKQKAIRQLNYSASTKVLFQVRRRFWEKEDGILGGATVTDLPIRRRSTIRRPIPTTSGA